MDKLSLYCNSPSFICGISCFKGNECIFVITVIMSCTTKARWPIPLIIFITVAPVSNQNNDQIIVFLPKSQRNKSSFVQLWVVLTKILLTSSVNPDLCKSTANSRKGGSVVQEGKFSQLSHHPLTFSVSCLCWMKISTSFCTNQHFTFVKAKAYQAYTRENKASVFFGGRGWNFYYLVIFSTLLPSGICLCFPRALFHNITFLQINFF